MKAQKRNFKAIVVRAWQIRKAAAAKFDCPVMKIVWGDCIRMATEGYSVLAGTIILTPADTVNNALASSCLFKDNSHPATMYFVSEYKVRNSVVYVGTDCVNIQDADTLKSRDFTHTEVLSAIENHDTWNAIVDRI